MMRLLLGVIALAIFQLGTPQRATAAELVPRGESTRPAPPFEALAKAAFARAGSRSDQFRLEAAPAFLAAGAPRLRELPFDFALAPRADAPSALRASTSGPPRSRAPPR